MPDILVRNLSAKMARALKERAAENGRSVQAEALAIIEAGVKPNGSDVVRWLRQRRPKETFDVAEALSAIYEAREAR